MKKSFLHSRFLLPALVISACFLFSECQKTTTSNGTIHFKCNLASAVKSANIISGITGNQAVAPYVCKISSIKWTIEEIAVSTQDIVNGKPDNLNWNVILTNNVLKNFNEYDFSVDLPTGVYKSIRIKMKNRGIWICTLNTKTYEFEDFNCSSCDPNGESPINYFYTDGLHYLDASGNFITQTPSEKISGLEIKEGKITLVSWLMNFNTLEWTDTNNNNAWDTGVDKLNNWTLLSGKNTMFDFQITYQ